MPSRFTPAQLSDLDRADFIAAIGGVFEHSPWVMARAWEMRPFSSRADLDAALVKVIREAGRDELLALIEAHPELAGKAAIRGDLTADSAREQAGAGLNACSPEEFELIQRLNRAYRARFGWPFIVAVKGMTRHDIIAAMERRLPQTSAEEFVEALAQILRIAGFRLDELLTDA